MNVTKNLKDLIWWRIPSAMVAFARLFPSIIAFKMARKAP